MTWAIILATSAAFGCGWVAHSWQCSKRRDCPRYVEYALKKWKREAEARVARHEKRRGQSHPTPPEGRAA